MEMKLVGWPMGGGNESRVMKLAVMLHIFFFLHMEVKKMIQQEMGEIRGPVLELISTFLSALLIFG